MIFFLFDFLVFFLVFFLPLILFLDETGLDVVPTQEYVRLLSHNTLLGVIF
jgi:hypothetical protein